MRIIYHVETTGDEAGNAIMPCDDKSLAFTVSGEAILEAVKNAIIAEAYELQIDYNGTRANAIVIDVTFACTLPIAVLEAV